MTRLAATGVALLALAGCATPDPGTITDLMVNGQCRLGTCEGLEPPSGEPLDIGLEWIEAEPGGMPGFRIMHRQTLSLAEADELVGW